MFGFKRDEIERELLALSMQKAGFPAGAAGSGKPGIGPMQTLPGDSSKRKEFPLLSGCLKYFPAALAGVAKLSKIGNDKHNPGQPLHHARGKSTDHGDCILRHLIDFEELLAASRRGDARVTKEAILMEASSIAWRALALSQEAHESFGAPLAPNAKEADDASI